MPFCRVSALYINILLYKSAVFGLGAKNTAATHNQACFLLFLRVQNYTALFVAFAGGSGCVWFKAHNQPCFLCDHCGHNRGILCVQIIGNETSFLFTRQSSKRQLLPLSQ